MVQQWENIKAPRLTRELSVCENASVRWYKRHPEPQNKRALLLTLADLLKRVRVHHSVKHLWAQKPWREVHKKQTFF